MQPPTTPLVDPEPAEVHALAGAWERDVGAQWRLVLILLTIGCGVAGALAPLIDPDLPMHLRTAEWILQHGRVPYTEPFAWTRPGAPFYAYSWLAELAYFGLFRSFGSAGLHGFHAFTAAGAFLAVIILGRAARWTPWGTLLCALMSFSVWIALIAAVRPQSLMALTLPFGWLAAEWIAGGRRRRGLALAFLLAALTTNLHVLFPLTFMPVIRLLVIQRVPWRDVVGFGIANVVGWLCTPYAFDVVDMMRINFTGNALIGSATSVMELESGFRAFAHTGISIRVAAIILMLLPLTLFSRTLTDRERFLYGLAWVGGLFLFGNAVRGLVIWLPASLPLLARAIAQIPLPQIAMNRRITVAATAMVPLGLIGSFGRGWDEVPRVDANVVTRQLPVPVAPIVEPIAQYLECVVRPPIGTRVFTTFNFGSYLVWRLPGLSFSIDGRNIYPDSVAGAEAYQLAMDGPLKLGPWRSAELAIAPLNHASARMIDSSPEWHRVRVAIPVDTLDHLQLGLWVSQRWLTSQRRDRMTEDTAKVTLDVSHRPCGAPAGPREGSR